MKEKSNKLEFFTQLVGLRKELWRDGKSCDGALVVIMLEGATVKELVLKKMVMVIVVMVTVVMVVIVIVVMIVMGLEVNVVTMIL